MCVRVCVNAHTYKHMYTNYVHTCIHIQVHSAIYSKHFVVKTLANLAIDNSPKFYLPTFLFHLDFLLYKYSIRQSFLYQTFLGTNPPSFLLPKFFTIQYMLQSYKLTLASQGSNFFHGVKFSVQTFSHGIAA